LELDDPQEEVDAELFDPFEEEKHESNFSGSHSPQ